MPMPQTPTCSLGRPSIFTFIPRQLHPASSAQIQASCKDSVSPREGCESRCEHSASIVQALCVMVQAPCVIVQAPCVMVQAPCVMVQAPCVIAQAPCVIVRAP